MEEASDNSQFRIYRWSEAQDAMEAGVLPPPNYTPLEEERMASIRAVNTSGAETRLLYSGPGFALTHVWFKKHYPLPLHSHDADCLYYIVSGSLRLGTEELGPRDGFFVPSDVPYAYVPGPEGVEVLEFRHVKTVDFKLHAKGKAFWAKAKQTVLDNSPDWATAKMPVLNG